MDEEDWRRKIVLQESESLIILMGEHVALKVIMPSLPGSGQDHRTARICKELEAAGFQVAMLSTYSENALKILLTDGIDESTFKAAKSVSG